MIYGPVAKVNKRFTSSSPGKKGPVFKSLKKVSKLVWLLSLSSGSPSFPCPGLCKLCRTSQLPACWAQVQPVGLPVHIPVSLSVGAVGAQEVAGGGGGGVGGRGGLVPT